VFSILTLRQKFWLRFFIYQLFFLLLWRLSFFLFFLGDEKVQGQLVFKAFYLGSKYDIRLLAAFLLVLMLLSCKGPFNFLKRNRFLAALLGWLFASLSFWFWIFNFGHYAYLSAPLNSGILEFGANADTSFLMIWQSYPVVWIGIGFIVFSILFILGQCLFVTKLLVPGKKELWGGWGSSISKKRLITSWGLIILLLIFGVYGKFSWYPLRWSDAFFSTNHLLGATAVHPLLYFADTLRFKKKTFDEKKYKEYLPQLRSFFGIEEKNSVGISLQRKEKSSFKPAKSPNIVIIVLESWVAYKTGLMNNPMKATPYTDALMEESLTFRRFYVPSQATARSMFGLITSIPDVSTNKTSTRNPLIAQQHTIWNQFQGYDKYFFLGGSASWGNIRGLLSSSIDGIQIFDEGSHSSRHPRVDVWGISDHHLMIEAHERFEKAKKPFVAVIQSSGFHRPYSIPSDAGDFKVDNDPAKAKIARSYGFSMEEYNSMRFQDYALGNFMELAKKSHYYDDTIFMVLGDHGLPSLHAKNIPVGEEALDLENFHVPFIVHGPKYFKAIYDDRFVSEVDVFPTALSLAGQNYTNTTLGRDIFQTTFDDRREVFVYYWYANQLRYGWLNKKFFLSTDVTGRYALYEYAVDGSKDVQSKYPEEAKRMKDMADAFFYSSQYLMFNNSPSLVK